MKAIKVCDRKIVSLTGSFLLSQAKTTRERIGAARDKLIIRKAQIEMGLLKSKPTSGFPHWIINILLKAWFSKYGERGWNKDPLGGFYWKHPWLTCIHTHVHTHPHTYLDDSAFVRRRKSHSLNMQHLMIKPDVKKHVDTLRLNICHGKSKYRSRNFF